MWERRARSGDGDVSPARSGAAVAPGRRPLTAGLPAAGESGWPAWTGAEAREEERAGQGSFLGVEVAAGPRLRFPWGAELPREREAMRREVERHWSGGGRVRVQTWLLQIEVLAATEEGAPIRSDGAAVEAGEVDAALAMAREEIDAVTAEERAFQERFERAARGLTSEMLAGSEATVRGSLAGYGIELGPVLEKAIEREGRTAGEIALDVLDNPLGPLGQAMVARDPALHAGAESETSAGAELAAAAQDLQVRAAELAEANSENDRLQVELQRRRGGVCHAAQHGAATDRPDFSYLEAFPAPELTLHGRRFAAQDEPDLGVQATGSARRVERLTGELGAAWRAHEARHPILAAYRNRAGHPNDELGRLTGGTGERHRELVRVSFERLCAIAKARQAVTSGAVSVLELPRVVEKTRVRLGVEPGSVQDAFIGNAVADASEPEWLAWVVTALSFASAVLLAPATAGSSAALALDIGFFTADVWFAIDAAAEYTLAAAASLTDYDRERSLSGEEPDFSAVIVGLVGTALGALGVVRGLTSGSRIHGTGGGDGGGVRRISEDVETGAHASRGADDAARLGDPPEPVGQRSVRVEQPVPGLHDDISVSNQIGAWKVRDTEEVEDGKKVITSWIALPDGRSGHVTRAYDPVTRTLEMREAFLDDLPRWIDNGRTPLVPGKGIPTVTFLTLRQMKKLGIGYGSVSKVKMSTIQNVRAVIEYNFLLSRGLSPAEAVIRTHSYRYGSTAIVQSGQSIVSVSVGGDIWVSPLADMLEHYERRAGREAAKVAKYHDDLIEELGGGVITRETPVSWNYDIEIDVAPFVREP